ncbi:MAG: hypothetical protein ABI850_05790 [Flavobacterium sp.]
MKKILFTAAFLFGFSLVSQAQNEGFHLGGHVGLPLSDASDFSSVNVGADANYLFGISDNFALGVATGYSAFLGKDDFDTYSFIPVAVSARANYSDSIFYAADVGYAVALDSDTDGGLYYQGKLGWTNSTLDIFAFYKGISADSSNISSVGLGVAVKL